MATKPTMVFVYNADSGIFNTLTDIAHKIFSPSTYQCQLCALTHSYFSARASWKDFLQKSDYPLEFLHRDQFIEQFPDDSTPLPAIFLKYEQKTQLWIERDAIRNCKDLTQLQQLIQNALTKLPRN